MAQPHKPEKAYKNLEFLNSTDARQIRILSEFLEPYYRFKKFKIDSTIVFFGSARILSKELAKQRLFETDAVYKQDQTTENQDKLETARLQLRLSFYYEEAVRLSKMITEWAMTDSKPSRQGIYICSGGGPGIMEAANKGARQAKGKSIGLNISIPMEQFPNSYISEELSFEFHYFFMRKYWFVYLAKALVVFPGGFGTLDEMMEVLTLIQTRKINRPLPIIILGQDYWREVINLEAMVRWGTISRQDLDLFHFVSDAEEAFEIIKEKVQLKP